MMIDARPESESLGFTAVPHHGDQEKKHRKQPVTAALPVRRAAPVWKSRCGFVRSRTVASWIRPVKA